MKLHFALLFFIINFLVGYSQEKYSYEFEKIIATDTISAQDQIADIVSGAELYDGKFLISYYENDRIPLLYKKEKDILISYNLDFADETNYELIKQSANKQYLFITGKGSHSARQTEFGYKTFYTIDVQNNKFVNFQYYSSMTFWAPNEEDPAGFTVTQEFTVTNSQLLIIEDIITVLSYFVSLTNEATRDNDVIKSGEYIIEESQIKKVKYYDENSMTFRPIRYAGKMAIGMTLDDVKLIYTDVDFVEKENSYRTCADENQQGFEIYDGTELLAFVPNELSENKILNLIILSPKINFGKISTNSTAQQILKTYPKSNVRLDSLSDWEHIYIAELNIELVFKTNENNRIAAYKKEVFSKLKNGSAKSDFIVIGR